MPELSKKPVIRRGATVAAVLAFVAGITPLALPVGAASAAAADTPGQFQVTAGGLAITVPTSTVNFGSVASGATSVSGPLGTVTVTDTRGLLTASWTATVSTTTFTTGGATTNETVAKSAVTYASGAATATTGVGVFTPVLVAVSLATPQTAATWTAGVANNTATWNPTLTFALLTTQVAGTYAGTITHSVT
jgi:hypothetical protein